MATPRRGFTAYEQRAALSWLASSHLFKEYIYKQYDTIMAEISNSALILRSNPLPQADAQPACRPH